MTTVASPSLSLLHLDFADLYARHLCRHSQLGINVIHLLSLFGVWYPVYAALYWLTGLEWLPVALAVAYVAVVAINAPVRVIVATAMFMVLFLAAVYGLPELPWWAYLVMVPVFYKVQSWSHLVYTAATDMTEFNKRYPKGFVLFVVLLIYEVPLVLNYFFFGGRDWRS